MTRRDTVMMLVLLLACLVAVGWAEWWMPSDW